MNYTNPNQEAKELFNQSLIEINFIINQKQRLKFAYENTHYKIRCLIKIFRNTQFKLNSWETETFTDKQINSKIDFLEDMLHESDIIYQQKLNDIENEKKGIFKM